MTYWQLWTTSVALCLAGACGQAEPASEAPSTPTDPMTTTAAEAPAAAPVTEQPTPGAEPEPEPVVLTEAPTGTPENFAQLLAAQRQALANGTKAMTKLAADLEDATARADLEVALRRLFELEELVLSLAPSEAARAEAESAAHLGVQKDFRLARKALHATPAGLQVFTEIQQAASRDD